MNSIVSYPDRGVGGNNLYRGNCSPKLIEDFIDQFNMKYLSDYMIGGGTTKDVCEAKGVKGVWTDLRLGFDMMNMDIPDRPENIFWHPPYADMIIYSDNMYSAKEVEEKYGYDPTKTDLSRCKDYESFVKAMNYCMMKMYSSLETGGRIGVLMGDMKRKGQLYSMLLDLCKPGTVENIVIKAQHNFLSGRTNYSGKFIPIVHEYFLIIKKMSAYMLDFSFTKKHQLDIRDCTDATWKDVVASVMENYKSKAVSLSQIYDEIKDFKKAKNNPHWKEKIRQVLQQFDLFCSVERGYWKMAA